MSISSRTRSKLKLRQREEEGVPVGVKRSKFKLKQREEERVSLEVKLPEEIHVEIFLKLPGKSILSCRCVCKFFYNVLSSPIFIKNHLNIHNKSNPKLLCFRRSRDYPPKIYSIPIDYASISSSSCNGAIQINYPFESNKIYHSNNILGSCNGLVCLKIVSSDIVKNVNNCYYTILNPLTGEYKDFSGPPNHGLKPVCHGRKVTYGFGYDSNLGDYKLVMISDFEQAGCFKIDVYAVKSDSWKRIQGTLNYSFYGERSRFSKGHKGSHGVLFNGSLHWLGFLGSKSTQVIICFDISNETIVDMRLPGNMMPPKYLWGEMHMKVGVWGDCICVTCVCGESRTEVWVMQEYGVKESWISKYVRRSSHLLPPLEHLGSYWQPLWCFHDGKILVDNCRKALLLFDPTNDTVSSVAVRNIIMDDNRESYVESIVSLKSETDYHGVLKSLKG